MPPQQLVRLDQAQRRTEWWDYLRVSVLPARRRPDAAIWQGDTMFVLKDFFTTRDGSWESVAGLHASCPVWARAGYNAIPWGQPGFFDDAGAATHLFGAVFGLDGKLKADECILFWSTGPGILSEIEAHAGDFVKAQTKPSGWANLPMEHGSWYDPASAAGPWCWAPLGLSDVMVGGGLPMSWHVSMFAVWQEVPRSAPPGEPGDPNDPPDPPPGSDLAAVVAEMRALRADLRRAFRLEA